MASVIAIDFDDVEAGLRVPDWLEIFRVFESIYKGRPLTSRVLRKEYDARTAGARRPQWSFCNALQACVSAGVVKRIGTKAPYTYALLPVPEMAVAAKEENQ
jgi:hypothetical protein